MFRHPLLALVVVAASLLASSAHAQSPADLLIRHATIVDVEHARLIADQAVVTSGNTILAVGPDAEIARAWRAAKTLDAEKRFLIPGLWDMHVHFGGGVDLIEENKALLPLYVAHGITTIRDASGDLPEQVLAWRREIASGALFGPTLLSSGPKIEGIKPVWKGTLETGSTADVDAAIAKLKALDVDFVKITDSTLKPELFLYAVRKARVGRLCGLPATSRWASLCARQSTLDSSSIEHIDYAVRAGVKDEPAIARPLPPATSTARKPAAGSMQGFDRATAKRRMPSSRGKGSQSPRLSMAAESWRGSIETRMRTTYI